MTSGSPLGYDKEYNNLLKVEIRGGNWVDAGCGDGAYTIPLTALVNSVLAIDIDERKLRNLKNRVNELKIENITFLMENLQNVEIYKKEVVQGILFAFSLHYQDNLDFILKILDEKKGRKDFKIIIIDYLRKTPIFWIPHPCPPEKILDLIEKRNDYKATIKFKSEKHYILEIIKI